MLNAFRQLRFLVWALAVVAVGCHAQTPPAGVKVSPELARRIEVLIRSRSDVPIPVVISIGDRTKSDIPGYDQIPVMFVTNGNASKPLTFLLSNDNKTLAQFNKFDMSQDPKDKVSAAARPGRGGADDAPVLIVGFDDLECPFCAKMHAELFPAIVERYKTLVHVAYLDFPLVDIHPWAMHAAIDANCLAVASPASYWSYVDYVHAHASEVGAGNSMEKAVAELDKIALEQGAMQKVNPSDLAACVKKQDDTKIKAQMKTGDSLGLNGTPVTYINGQKLDGVVPIEDVFRVIDGALIAAGKTPPPAPPVAPAPASAKLPPAAAPAAK